jgi:hypothetical protein
MSKLLAGAAALALFATPAWADQFTLTSPLSADNGSDGIMFDILIGDRDVTFQSIAVDLDLVTETYQFWTRDGTHRDSPNNMNGWTLRGTFSDVTTNGAAALTSFDFDDFTVLAGGSIGVYFTGTTQDGSTVNYNNFYSDDDVADDGRITITEGRGKRYPFSTNNVDRGFVGSITYSADVSAGVPEPASWAMMLGGFGLVGAALRGRRRARVRFG